MLKLHDFVIWTYPGTVDTFPSRGVPYFQFNLLELGRA